LNIQTKSPNKEVFSALENNEEENKERKKSEDRLGEQKGVLIPQKVYNGIPSWKICRWKRWETLQHLGINHSLAQNTANQNLDWGQGLVQPIIEQCWMGLKESIRDDPQEVTSFDGISNESQRDPIRWTNCLAPRLRGQPMMRHGRIMTEGEPSVL